MNRVIKKSLNKKLMILSLIVVNLTLISNVTIVSATHVLNNPTKYEKVSSHEISEIGYINAEIGLDWSNPDKGAIYGKDDGHICILNAKVAHEKNGEAQQYITIDEYDSSVSYLSSKIVILPYSSWGGFYNCEDGNFYVVVGQDNEEEDDNKVVYSIIKFNPEWKEVKRVNITGKQSKTVVPFKSGNCNISFNNGVLTVGDFREVYKKMGLNNNEGEISFRINTSNMKVE